MKIFVAKLSQNTTSESLQMLFEQYGEVTSSKVIMDHESGRSKCYGFVEMSDDEKATQAISDLDGVEYEGSVIAIKEAVPHEEYKKNNPTEKVVARPRNNYSHSAPRGGHRPSYNNSHRENYSPRHEGGYRHREDNEYGSREGGYHHHRQQGERPYRSYGQNQGQRYSTPRGGNRQYRPRPNNDRYYGGENNTMETGNEE